MKEGWKNIEIDKIVLKTILKDPTKEPEKHFYYVDVSSVSNVLFKIEEPNYITGKEAPSRARKLIQKDDVIFATVRPTLKRIAYVLKEFDNQVCSTGYCVLKADKKQVDPLFLYFSLLPDYFMERIEKLQRGASYPAIRDYDLKSQKILLPPLPEQRKITYILSTVQKAIEQQDKLIRHTTELKKALMQKLFTEGLSYDLNDEMNTMINAKNKNHSPSKNQKNHSARQKMTEIGLVPESWEVVRIESLFDIQQGKQVSKSNRVGNNQKPFLRTANVFWGYIDFTELDEMNFSKEEEAKFTLKRDDLLVCEGGDVGRTSIWEYDKQEIYYQNHLHRLRRKKDNIIPKYFMYWMSLIVQETSYIKDAGNRTTIPNLSKSRLGGLYFSKPKIQYQEKVVSILQGLDNKTKFHQKKKQTLTALFKTLLHELMTGERRVNEIEMILSEPLIDTD